MAYPPRSRLQRSWEYVLGHPWRASLIVGGVISTLQLLVRQLAGHWPPLLYLGLLVPFIPPYLASRTSRRIHEREGEHDFVRDALPYIFVAHPRQLSRKVLHSCRPAMLSNSAQQHTGRPLAELLAQPVLPAALFAQPAERERILEYLLREAQAHGRAHISDHPLTLLISGQPQCFVLNSVLKPGPAGWKWQGLLVRYEPERYDPTVLRH